MKSSTPCTMIPFRLSALALLVALASPVTLAQERGWYGGVGLGESRTDIDTAGLVAALQARGYGTSQISQDDRDVAGKVFGGYSFSRNLALEAGYFDAGNFDFSANVLPAAVQKGEASIRGLSVDLVGTLPLSGKLSAFARVGLNNARIGQSFSNSSAGTGLTDHTDRGTHEKYGGGLQYAVNEAFSVRAELERYRIDDNQVTDDMVDTLSIGIVYRFGMRKPAAPVAQPVESPPPAPALPVQITLSASALFDFDRAELKPAGRAELDKLVQDMQGLRYEVVIVTGHTDRIGTRSYNLALSERRADVVRDYLIAAGIPAARITARGVNSDEPVTTAQQCQGPVDDTLKACLQPDRRVEIDVSGTRDSD